jgi:type II secretory pathway pseudopilin PulG
MKYLARAHRGIRGTGGFTIIELAVVLGVVGAVAVLLRLL